MKNKKLTSAFAAFNRTSSWAVMMMALVLTVGMVACDEETEDPTNVITITFDEPMNEQVFDSTTCGDVHIHVEVSATDEIHNLEVVVHPEGHEDDKIIDFDGHIHESTYTFMQDINICSYPSGTEFHMEVTACKDHDCAETETADIHFEIQ